MGAITRRSQWHEVDELVIDGAHSMMHGALEISLTMVWRSALSASGVLKGVGARRGVVLPLGCTLCDDDVNGSLE